MPNYTGRSVDAAFGQGLLGTLPGRGTAETAGRAAITADYPGRGTGETQGRAAITAAYPGRGTGAVWARGSLPLIIGRGAATTFVRANIGGHTAVAGGGLDEATTRRDLLLAARTGNTAGLERRLTDEIDGV